MAMTYAPVVDAPVSSDALYVSFPISKMEKDTRGNLIIKGVATDATVDHDHQIVDSDWSAKALTEWLATGGNVRMSHDSKRPIGKGVQVELDRDGDGKHWVKSVIVDPLAIKLVEEGVLRAYSVGIIDPVIKRDPTGRAAGGIICGGTLAELSVVDRPANKNAYLELAKAAADGSAMLTGTMYADNDLLKQVGDSIASIVQADDDLVEVSLPRNAQISFSPADMARVLKARGADVAKRDMDPDVGGGTDRDKIPAADFAGRNRSFPIVTPGDVSDAASSIGRAGPDNYGSEQLKDNIIRIARRKGPSFVAQLPDAWTEGESNKAMADDIMDEAEAIAKGKKPAFEGAAPAFDGTDSDGDGNDTDKPGSHLDDDGSEPKVKPGSSGKAADGGSVPDDKDDDDATYDNEGAAKPGDDGSEDAAGSTSATKAVVKGMKDCTKCGKEYHADSKMKRCESCNAKLPKANKGARITAGRTQPTPADGVAGEHAAPVAPHREPDGPAIEQFEADMKIPTDPDSNYAKAVRRLKSLGVPEDMGSLHDMLCPAFDPAAVNKAYPFTKLEGLDTSAWQMKALDAAASAPLHLAKSAAQLWQHSVTLAETHPGMLAELRLEANKAFADANMGPSSAPKPTEITATRFNRPLLTSGHARPSFQHDGPNTGPHPGEITPNMFGRGPLTAGRAEESPSNKGIPVEPPTTTGHPQRVFYSNSQRDNARQAMTALHDHIAQTFPDLCPMCAPGAPTVNHGVPEAQKTVEQVAGVAVTDEPLPPEVQRLIAKGLMTEEAARDALAPDPEPAPVVKGKKSKKGPKIPKPSAAPVDADALKSLIAEALAPLHQQLEAANKALESARNDNAELRKTVDAIASQPEPVGPWRGEAVLRPTQMPGVQKSAPMDAAQIAAQAQQALQRELEHQFNTSTDPAAREAAWSAMSRMRGMR
jgi:phage head maturation protease